MTRRRDTIAEAPLLAWGEALRHAKERRARLRARVVVLGACAGSTLLLVAHVPSPRLVWNASASAPVGLYLVRPGVAPATGDMVIAQVPAAYRLLAAGRRYLPANVPLVKRVAASTGDEICALGLQIFINGHWVTDRRAVDGQRRPMPTWSGCIQLHGRQVFLLMPDPASFDGRYFGATEGSDIVGRARLLWRR